jgi:hypothetical protein
MRSTMLAARGGGEGEEERGTNWCINSGNLKSRWYIDEIVTIEIRKYDFYYARENTCNMKTHRSKQFAKARYFISRNKMHMRINI